MKKSIVIALAFVGGISISAMAQQQRGVDSSKDGQKDVQVEVVNGVKVLTVTSYKDGQAHEMRYTGDAADKMEQQIAEEKAKEAGEIVDVNMIEVDGKKQLTVVREKNGVSTTEVFEGAEAEAKLKELEAAEAKKIEIKVEKKIIEKSNM
jgi:hypothetical protein